MKNWISEYFEKPAVPLPACTDILIFVHCPDIIMDDEWKSLGSAKAHNFATMGFLSLCRTSSKVRSAYERHFIPERQRVIRDPPTKEWASSSKTESENMKHEKKKAWPGIKPLIQLRGSFPLSYIYLQFKIWVISDISILVKLLPNTGYKGCVDGHQCQPIRQAEKPRQVRKRKIAVDA